MSNALVEKVEQVADLERQVEELQRQLDEAETKLFEYEGAEPGGEAEELRQGIEKAIEKFEGYHDDDMKIDDAKRCLRNLLDETDARDSVAYLESTRERFGALCHSQWSGWAAYLFGRSTDNEDGSVTIPRECVTQWSRRATLLWSEMTPQEKRSSLEEADNFMQVLLHPEAPTAGSRERIVWTVNTHEGPFAIFLSEKGARVFGSEPHAAEGPYTLGKWRAVPIEEAQP